MKKIHCPICFVKNILGIKNESTGKQNETSNIAIYSIYEPMAMAEKAKWFLEDQDGNKSDFKSNGLSKFIRNKKGKTIKISIKESGKDVTFLADFKVGGAASHPDNEPPTVSAGDDITVKSGRLGIIIDGSATDLDGTITSVDWFQTVGPMVSVTLDETDPTKFTFDAPTLRDENPIHLEFLLRATDDKGAKTEDPIKITVTKDGLPPQEEGPGKLIYDSNIDGKWNNGNAREIGEGEKDGNIGPNGKGLFTAASGDPKFIIDGHGVGTLKTKPRDGNPSFGRIYICVNNYNSLEEFSFNIKSSTVDEMSLKSRSRHQEGGDCENRFGGFGSTTSTEEVDFKTESCHNHHENGMTKDLSKELSLNTWYKTRYQVKDIQDNGDTVVQFMRWIDYDDGNGYVMVFQGTHRNPKDYYLDKAKFMEKSMFWIRLNGHGEIAIKDLKIWDLDEPA